MSVEVDGGPTVGLNSTVKLSLYADLGTKDQKRKSSNGFFLDEIEGDGDRRSDTSSIGACSSEEDEDRDDNEEVSSKDNGENKSSLSSLDSLEDSLPDKRGLSSFYSGKSKSFTSLTNVVNSTAKDLIKPENPFNKRRRILMAWSRRASCSSLISMESSFLPPLISSGETLEEGEEGEEEEEIEEKGANCKQKLLIFTPIWKHDESNKAKIAFRSPRSFSLSDLNKHALAD